MVNVCIPVLRRYDLLRDLLLSLRESTVMPDEVHIINNGQDVDKLHAAVEVTPPKVKLRVLTPQTPMGVAESWNWFIANVSEERVVANDDIAFAPESLSKLTASKADLAWAEGCGFACFLLRDSCVQKIGLFDEKISPGYGYYEDEDYLQRLDGRGTRPASAIAENVECGIKHFQSGTLKHATHKELMEHHRRFKIAQANYIRKWSLQESFR